MQTKPGEENNLLTVTNNGQVYPYILKYAKQLPKPNYFIPEENGIGNERPKKIGQKPTVQIRDTSKTAYFQKFSAYLLKSNYESMATKGKKGVRLQLQKMVYNTSEVYLVLEIKNSSGIDFEIDYLNIYRTNGNKKRKASFQRLGQNVIHQFKMPNQVKVGEKNVLCMCLQSL
ncbi:DUF4138 domain-containing protein [Maribacter sp. 2304DJ31-5]|uniref:DUF4138 domain-containing protein n=1 Tax=Maribacter sp. 2304DJ31-5 TaxID=3386273 RepID=UPI0039BD7C19